MKKIILVVLLALSLQADATCGYWVDVYDKEFKLLVYAIDREDFSRAVRVGNSTLTYAEHVSVSCSHIDKNATKAIDDFREALKSSIKQWKINGY